MGHVAEADALPLPFEDDWSAETMASAVLYFTALLLSALGGRLPNGPASFISDLLGQRWEHPERLLRKAHAEIYRDLAEIADVPCVPDLGADLRAKFGRYATERAAALARIDGGALHVLTADQVEQLVAWAAGTPAATHALLRRLESCLADGVRATGEEEQCAEGEA